MIRRGQVWWADLADPVGSEPGYRRPVLVVQRDEVNASEIATVVVCAIAGRKALAGAPGNTLLPKRASGLSRDSVANASQLLAIDRGDLDMLAGTLPAALMDRVDDGLRWFLKLDWS